MQIKVEKSKKSGTTSRNNPKYKKVHIKILKLGKVHARIPQYRIIALIPINALNKKTLITRCL